MSEEKKEVINFGRQELDPSEAENYSKKIEKARSLEVTAVIESLRHNQFDTVLGSLDFDDKGDLVALIPALYVWRHQGPYLPLEPAQMPRPGRRDRPAERSAVERH